MQMVTRYANRTRENQTCFKFYSNLGITVIVLLQKTFVLPQLSATLLAFASDVVIKTDRLWKFDRICCTTMTASSTLARLDTNTTYRQTTGIVMDEGAERAQLNAFVSFG